MARKMKIDTSIAADIKSAASDSFKDNIKMIEIGKIKASLDNFYSMSDVDILADDIERQGLKHNLVVVEDSDEHGTYFIKSGHRRYAAIQQLVSEGRYNSKYIPCLIDGSKTKDESILDLIMLNATTRVMSDSEIYKQYEVLKETLDNLKASGDYYLKGRMREKLAEALNVSSAQVGKIENIKHNAVEEVKEAVANGDMKITTADEIAKLPEDEQVEIITEKPVSEITTKDVKERKEKKAAAKKKAEPVVTVDDDIEDETESEAFVEESEDIDDIDVDTSESDSEFSEVEDEDELNAFPSDEGIRAAAEKQAKLTKWAQGLSQEQLQFLLDGGWYNNTIKGYLLFSAEIADFTTEQQNMLLGGLRIALDRYDKKEAEHKYLNY